ncbi:ATPase subunit 9 [Perkinsela sp. CCAP 1560/4]|nr:ATPase subunit 9 [Perkinsela sp. CCAP 1560/4]|eukprot:KNH01796.1 ATPase subunit 9 [Perkinsela sp. CCAP 1560/4]
MIRRLQTNVPKAFTQNTQLCLTPLSAGVLINKPYESIRCASSVTVTIQGLHYVGAGLAAIALAGVGVGIGSVFGSLLLACSRQPNMAKQLFNYAVLGFALTEAIGLFALMLAFLMLFS